MIYWLYGLRHLLEEDNLLYKLLNLFKYQTFRAGGACLTAFVICLLVGPWMIARLRALKAGQPLRTAAEVHKLAELHEGKKGTPTMGGVLIIFAVVMSTLLWCRLDNVFVWACLFAMISMGAVGFWDDYVKVRKKHSGGITPRQKMLGLFGSALAVACILVFHPPIWKYISHLHIPFFKEPLYLAYGMIPFMVIVIIGASNAVNLTDGLDGLASGCTVSSAFAYATFAYVAGNRELADYLFVSHHPDVGEVAVLANALIGAAFGFLWFNCHPARVFMGDTGALAIGGLLATIAICCRQELIFIVVGGVFVMEAMSVMIQVFSFKLRKKRVFRMAPIHHHFELKGWKEGQVITRFWIMSFFFAMLGLATLKIR